LDLGHVPAEHRALPRLVVRALLDADHPAVGREHERVCVLAHDPEAESIDEEGAAPRGVGRDEEADHLGRVQDRGSPPDLRFVLGHDLLRSSATREQREDEHGDRSSLVGSRLGPHDPESVPSRSRPRSR
jgi:hypothetical protein